MAAYALVLDESAAEFQWLPVDVVASAASGLTFDLCPEYEMPVTYRRRGLRTPASSGFVQRRTIWGEGDLRTFTLGWRSMNSAEVARLRDIWDRTRGPVLAMNYTPPVGAAAVVRFKRPALRLAPRARDAWAVQVELEEVR